MNKLRKNLIDQLTIGGYSPATIKTYVRHVADLAKHYNRSPDQISLQEVHAYLAQLLREGKCAESNVRRIVNALKFFYSRVVGWPTDELDRMRPKRKLPLKRPTIYSHKEIERLLTWEGFNPKYRALFMTIYGAGLRLGEACRLKVSDVKGDRNQLRIVQGKGRKDRYTVLFPVLVQELRTYWRCYRPDYWLFPSASNGKGPFRPRIAQMTFQKARRALGLPPGTVHSLRHSFSTHCLELQVSIMTLKEWLGHSDLTTTCHYLHYVRPDIKNLKSPLDLIDLSGIDDK